jgi:anaerobic selenocysteine-containing dehydrogenase
MGAASFQPAIALAGVAEPARLAHGPPVIRGVGAGQLRHSEYTRTLQPRIADADAVVDGICPHCAVGGSQLIYVKDGKVIDIEGNPRSLINGGTLCPKGAAMPAWAAPRSTTKRTT